MIEICELTRVALNKHNTPVSKIVSIALKMLRKKEPGLRLVVSYADPAQGHEGKIYQAMNWVYEGDVECTPQYFYKGRWCHSRQVNSVRGTVVGLPSRPVPDKHKYLYPLDDAMRKQIESLRKPYPKRNHADEATE